MNITHKYAVKLNSCYRFKDKPKANSVRGQKHKAKAYEAM